MPTFNVKIELDVRVPMHDRVKLSTDIYRPDAKGRFPAIVARTPYDNSAHAAKGKLCAGRGYAYVTQDCRGRYDSDGKFYPWHDEADDGYDTLKWIAQQEWCDGNIGMAGGSYVGLVQWLAAIRGSHLLKCIAPRVITSNFYDSPNY
jgi:putative CocE/NonD family hydrolase